MPEELHQDTHIIHWTRTSNSAWPGERKIDYYQAILTIRYVSQNSFPYSAKYTCHTYDSLLIEPYPAKNVRRFLFGVRAGHSSFRS